MAEGVQIVGLGLATLDVLIRTENMPQWDLGGRFEAFGFDGGGPVGTAMCAASRLGARVGFVGTAGNDHVADLKVQLLRDFDMDLSRLLRRDQPEDQVVIVYVDARTGERVFTGFGRPRDNLLRPDELDRDYITSADMLHLEGMHPEAALQAAKWMREAGKPVMLDGSKTREASIRPHLQALIPYVSILICGEGFGRALSGVEGLYEAGERILEMGPEIVVQTEGADGSYTVTRDDRFHTPAFEVDVVDTTGAGDVFHGAWLVGMLHHWDLRTVARFATAVSALKCMGLGGRGPIPTMPQVAEFLEQRGQPLP
ncbi:MAG: carbohydrate kinase family protein [Anaerolineae bacterium]|jgi:sulfofructose kinase|nr:carbohydrate kinase family protein [Chloroflexota bacterium]